ncbi:hypothetical protein AA637_12900 [Cyanobacterium sp. HL-69]|uniref:hypothetical protein n=1 Tax=Cyanobacterium sp. HL-69 TaxID=2054282 RepID=UPI000CA340AF|nr:hypothetical protein AA637_12900 [Cyanobacterium sp. HL-69]
MATQEKILNQLQILTNISQEGSYSDTFISALRNIFLTEIDNIEQQIKDIKIDLKAFEQQYKMSSEQFYEQFEKGILGDDIDFVEWKAYYQMWHSLHERLNLLQSQL